VALGGFHSQAGWLAFNAVALGVVIVARRSPLFAADRQTSGATPAASPTVAYLAPLFAIVAVTMVSGAFTRGFDQFYPLRVLAASVILWRCRRSYTDLRRTVSREAVAVGVAVWVLWMALEPRPIGAGSGSGSDLSTGLASLSTVWAGAWLAFRAVGSVVTVPLAEELAFRGYIARRLIARDFQDVPAGQFAWPSFLLSSVLFGALHGRWLAGTLAGMLYAVALYRRRELSDAVVAHATTNALIAAYVLATGSWTLWL
jgi:CAAX prenyl protease-like protein